MLRLDAERPVSFCDGFTRRDFLHAGALSALGLTLPGFFAHQAAGATRDNDVNCIMLFLVGGPSQIDTWDPKPLAPEEVRGPFKAIRTSVPGMQISEIFPRMARHADKYSLIRSVYHTATAVHDTGHQMMQTGRLFTGGVEHPHAGSVLGYLKGGRGEVPAHVLLPRPIGRTGGNMPHGQTAGYLGKQHDPFVLNADPNAPDFQVPDLLPPAYISAVRAKRRQKMRAAVEGELATFEKSSQAKQLDSNFDLAYRLMSSKAAREAFALEQEPVATRDRYGRTRFGQSCLLARRLIERGVRFVTVNMFETVFDEITWDIHGSKPFTDIAEMSRLVAPNFDLAFSTLLEDLKDRGLLQNTIVTALGEFGRTPKVNPAGGRDHHPGVWTILMGGGPLKGGRIVGESDALGYVPKTRPVTSGEVAATLFKGLGLDPHRELPGPQNRPIPLVDYGVKPINESLRTVRMADDNIQPEPPRGSGPRRGDDIQGQRPRRRRDEDEDEDEERRPRKRRDDEEDEYEDRVRRKDDGLGGLIPYRNPNALISYYCGVFALIPCVGLILGPVALVLGFLGLSYNKKHPTAGGVAHAIVGIVLGSLVLLGHAAVILLAFAGAIFK